MYHHFYQHIYSLKDISEIFSNFAVGLEALAGTFAGIKILYDWLVETDRKKKIIQYRAIYPPQGLGKSYLIADSVAHQGKIYIVDLRNHQKQWIQSSSTFIDLGFDWGNVNHMPVDEFNSYKEKEPILTSGTPWS